MKLYSDAELSLLSEQLGERKQKIIMWFTLDLQKKDKNKKSQRKYSAVIQLGAQISVHLWLGLVEPD